MNKDFIWTLTCEQVIAFAFVTKGQVGMNNNLYAMNERLFAACNLTNKQVLITASPCGAHVSRGDR